MKKIIISLVVLVVVSLIIFFGSSDKKMISIGAAIPETGFGAFWGEGVKMGINLARIDLENEYGKNNVSIIVEDSQSNVSVAATVAKKMLDIDKVDVLYTEFSGMASSIAPIAKSADKVLVYSAFNQKIAEDNPNTVKTFVGYEVVCEKFTKAYANPNTRILILSKLVDVVPYCMNGLEKVIPTSNIKIIENITGNDFRTILTQNKDFHPDYIFSIMYEADSFNLIKQNVELGVNAKVFCYKQDCATENNLNSLSGTAKNKVTVFEIPLSEAFKEKAKQMYPNATFDQVSAMANVYQSLMATGHALASCGTKSASCVIDKINSNNYIPEGYAGAKFANRILQSDVVISKLVQ